MKNNKQGTGDQLPDWLERLQTKGDGLQSPDADYFQELARRITAGEAQEKSFEPRPLQLSTSRSAAIKSWWWAAAASLLLLLWWSASDGEALLPTTAPTAQEASWQNQLDQLSEEELRAYIQENIQEFELETLLAIND